MGHSGNLGIFNFAILLKSWKLDLHKMFMFYSTSTQHNNGQIPINDALKTSNVTQLIHTCLSCIVLRQHADSFNTCSTTTTSIHPVHHTLSACHSLFYYDVTDDICKKFLYYDIIATYVKTIQCLSKVTFSALTLLFGRQEGHPAWKKTEWWVAGIVICLEQGADLHMAQLMPLPLTVSCFSKIQIGFTFLVQANPGSPGKRALKRVCVCLSKEKLKQKNTIINIHKNNARCTQPGIQQPTDWL